MKVCDENCCQIASLCGLRLFVLMICLKIKVLVKLVPVLLCAVDSTVCPAIQHAQTYHQATVKNSVCLFILCQHCQRLSYLAGPQLEILSFMVTVVGPKQ